MRYRISGHRVGVGGRESAKKMCGISSVVSSRSLAPPPSRALFEAVAKLKQASLQDPRQAVIPLEAAREAAQLWVSRSGILVALRDPALEARLADAARVLENWVRLPELANSTSEEHNRLFVTAKDVAWQLRDDVLGNLGRIRELVEQDSDTALIHGYELNLILRSLDRLEVRGRDSAGLAVYVSFESQQGLENWLDSLPRRGKEADDRHDPLLRHGAVIRPPSSPETLLFVHKVAAEVGKMGDNVSFLRKAIRQDHLFQSLLATPEARFRYLAHTRWASNGVISEANAHPVDSTVLSAGRPVLDSPGKLVAALNGDIDNYRDLVSRYATDVGRHIDNRISTDAKIIPIVVAHHLAQCGDLAEAFGRAVEEFEGSMAIGIMSASHDEILFAQKGSGQALFFGNGGESTAVASEMYGVIELSPRYLKAEGERSPNGEKFSLRPRDGGTQLDILGHEAAAEPPKKRWQRAEITTRDIDRGSYPHFFLKEISESVESAKRTIRGKFRKEGAGRRFCLGPETLPERVVDGLHSGAIRQIWAVGQGTAAVAARGVAHLLERALCRTPKDAPPTSLSRSLRVDAEKASEFSAHHLKDDLSDTLLVAVSQSGTTTDTIRTVDLARNRGAHVISIVNRRNSHLVYQSDGVLYTSDGRDVEMSVASTKAFYAQNVAGQVLALALAEALATMSRAELDAELADLEAFPEVLEKTLALSDSIAALAAQFALLRNHWAVVGSGTSKIAADEIRIKLSELCYRSISVDHTEDKKHIDLSCEPLILVCAAGIAHHLVSDAAKEVAVFKAHNSLPLVITEEGVDDFDTYSRAVVKLSRGSGALAYLPITMAGHLFGYHAAVEMDQVANRLRSVRSHVVALLRTGNGKAETSLWDLERLPASAVQSLSHFGRRLEDGSLNAALDAGTAVRLSRVIQCLLGRSPGDNLSTLSSGDGIAETIVRVLTHSITELARPIDAIRHQAKTVTVGISRPERAPRSGSLWQTLRTLGLDERSLPESHRGFLDALQPLVQSVEGATLYALGSLDPLGRPAPASTISVEKKVGSSLEIPSRNESPRPLRGTKWEVVKNRQFFLGRGQSDQRKILILPVVGEDPSGHVLIYHLELKRKGKRSERLRALKAHGRFFDRLKAAVTERDLEWNPGLIDHLDNDTLFLDAAETVAARMAGVPSP